MAERARDIVYRWVAISEDPIARPATLPAIRVLADALIDWTAATRGLYPPGLNSLRVGALYAWPSAEPPKGIVPPPYTELAALSVRSNGAFVGDMSALDDIFAVEAWAQALTSLGDYGAKMDQIEEKVGFVLNVETHMRVDVGSSTIASLPTELREGLLAYFNPPVNHYLGSLQTLADFRNNECLDTVWEVVIPADEVARAL